LIATECRLDRQLELDASDELLATFIRQDSQRIRVHRRAGGHEGHITRNLRVLAEEIIIRAQGELVGGVLLLRQLAVEMGQIPSNVWFPLGVGDEISTLREEAGVEEVAGNRRRSGGDDDRLGDVVVVAVDRGISAQAPGGVVLAVEGVEEIVLVAVLGPFTAGAEDKDIFLVVES